MMLAVLSLGACGDGIEEPPALPAPELPGEKPPEQQPDLEALASSREVSARNVPFGSVPEADESRHVMVSDGTRLAINIFHPPSASGSGARAPVIYIESWYGRVLEGTMNAINLYRAAGFVVAIGDSRGFGASFGAQTSFVSARARQDQREIIGWLATQPWSTGAVSVAGISLSASLAEVMAASGAPGLRAAIIRAADFDHYDDNLFPGGVLNRNMAEGVVGLTMFLARGGACVKDLQACMGLPMPVFPPVAGDSDRSLLRAALLDRQASFDTSGLLDVQFRDDSVGGATFAEMSGLGYLADLRRTALPARVSASWMDGVTARGALTRFQEMPGVPMEVVIGSTTHSGGLDADPFARQPFGVARPDALAQFQGDIAFVKRVLAGQTIARSVSYLVHGTNTWKSTPVWPPANTNQWTLHLGRGTLVSGGAPPADSLSYTVDPTASSGGPYNRWASQRNAPVWYGDRRLAPGRRLTFDAAPVKTDTELVGAPELCLAMRTDQSDGLVIAYLEDVGPDGRVTHLTEGLLRLVHRSAGGPVCDPSPGTRRSFQRAHAMPVVPGQAMRFELPLLPTAALIRKGHRLRVSLAGADAGTFPTMTPTPATWLVSTGAMEGSTLTVPVRPWSDRN